MRNASIVESSSCSQADEDMHIVFSTGCNAFQHWQAEVLLNSAYHIKQCGKITRIVVGCEKDVGHEEFATHPSDAASSHVIEADNLKRSTNPNLEVHVAPAIEEAKHFPWYNKPWS